MCGCGHAGSPPRIQFPLRVSQVLRRSPPRAAETWQTWADIIIENEEFQFFAELAISRFFASSSIAK